MKLKILALLAAMLGASPAVAQVQSFYNLTDSQDGQFKIGTFNCRAAQTLCLLSVPSDYNGNPLMGSIGVTNTNGTAEYIQGVIGGVPVSVSLLSLPGFASPPTFNLGFLNGTAPSATNPLFIAPGSGASFNVVCTSGCNGGGGGGGGAVFGPTAVGLNIANPPVMVGGSQNGVAGGLVGIWKVDGTGTGFINCANCSGTGVAVSYAGAIGSVGTPGGFKDGSGNFQPELGDTTFGTWVSIKNSVALSISSGTVSLTGTLPAFAATPTVNIGTAPAITVNGTFWQTTQPVSAASLPLPTGASTSALQTTGNTSLASILTALGAPMQQTGGSVSISGTPAITGTVTANAGTNLNTSLLALEGGGNLASINTKTPALGQALAAASTPVVLTALQVTALTPPTTVAVTQSTGTNLHMVCDSGCAGSSATFGAAFPATGSAIGMSQGGNLVAMTGTAGSLNVNVTGGGGGGLSVPFAGAIGANGTPNGYKDASGNFQPILGDVTNGQWVSIKSSVSLAVTGTFFQATQPVSATSLPLPTGAATQTTSAAILTALGTPFQAGGSIGNTTFAATQATAGNLNATVVGTGTFAVQAAQSGTWNITNVSGTVSLPTGASTSALQPTNAAIASTTAAQTGHLVMGAVTTAAPTYTTAQTDPLSLTTAGALRVDGSGVTQPVSLTSTTITGTVAATQSGTWNVTNISGTISLPTGAATSAKQPALGTAGAASADVLTIQGVASMTPVQVSQATAANLNATVAPSSLSAWGILAQAATTSGSSGQMVMGAVTTAAPGYTSGQLDPLSLDTTGNLRVNCVTGCSAATSITGWAGSTIGTGTIQAFGATAGTIGTGLVPAINAYVVNAQTPGSALSAVSSPVVIASDQAAVAIKAASASIASGAIASGAVASGAIAAGAVSAGAVVSGAILSGALASGAVVDITNMSGATTGAVPSKAIYAGGNASSTEPVVATTGNITGQLLDLTGKSVTSPYANREVMWRGGGTTTSTTPVTLLAAAGAGIKTYMTDISCTRNDAGTTAISVTLSDASAMQFDIPDNGGGGGYTHTFNVPLVTAANTALTATPSSGVTTLKCWASGFKGY